MQEPGAHYAIEDAIVARLQQAGTDDQVSLLIEALEEYWDDEVAFDSGVLWDTVHRCLCDGVADDADPLRLVVLGGAPQDHAPDGRLVALVASEHVPLVAAALAAVDPAWLRGRHGNLGLPEDFAEVRAIVEGIARFYQAAAGSGCAVVVATPSARA